MIDKKKDSGSGLIIDKLGNLSSGRFIDCKSKMLLILRQAHTNNFWEWKVTDNRTSVLPHHLKALKWNHVFSYNYGVTDKITWQDFWRSFHSP